MTVVHKALAEWFSIDKALAGRLSMLEVGGGSVKKKLSAGQEDDTAQAESNQSRSSVVRMMLE